MADWQSCGLGSCVAPILRTNLSEDESCTSETAFQAFVKNAPVEPCVQETGIKGVATTCPIRHINLSCFAEKTLTPEIGFCTHIAQRRYHRNVAL